MRNLALNSVNQIIRSGYGYGAAANQTASPTVTQMTYNAANQMTQTKVGNTATDHTYTGPDRTTAATPISYSTSGVTTYIARGDSGMPLGANIGGIDTARATNGPGSVVATVRLAGTKAIGYTCRPFAVDNAGNDTDPSGTFYEKLPIGGCAAVRQPRSRIRKPRHHLRSSAVAGLEMAVLEDLTISSTDPLIR